MEQIRKNDWLRELKTLEPLYDNRPIPSFSEIDNRMRALKEEIANGLRSLGSVGERRSDYLSSLGDLALAVGGRFPINMYTNPFLRRHLPDARDRSFWKAVVTVEDSSIEMIRLAIVQEAYISLFEAYGVDKTDPSINLRELDSYLRMNQSQRADADSFSRSLESSPQLRR